MRHESVKRALNKLSEACGDLSARRKRGNFFSSTLKAIESEDEVICDAISELVGYVEELEAENAHLREEIAKEDPAFNAIQELSERTGVCAADLAEKSYEELDALAKAEGIALDPESAATEAEQIAAAKSEGHECSVCAMKGNG